MSISLKILVRIASYGPQIDQSQGENRLSHIIRYILGDVQVANIIKVSCGTNWLVQYSLEQSVIKCTDY